MVVPKRRFSSTRRLQAHSFSFQNALARHRRSKLFVFLVPFLFCLFLILLFCRRLAPATNTPRIEHPYSRRSTRFSGPPPLEIILPSRTTIPGKVLLASVGDILLGARSDAVIAKSGYASLFAHIRSALSPNDVLMGNLEAPVTNITRPAYPDKAYVNTMRSGAVAALKKEGFRILTLANNHMMDMGADGLLDTIREVQRNEMVPLGGGRNEREARKGVVVKSDNGIAIGILAYMQNYGKYGEMRWFARGRLAGVAEASARALKDDIARLRQHADVVIVHLHAGECYKRVVKDQKLLARAVIDAGADVVNGHHPHIVQYVEMYNGKPILYSVGNFMFGTRGRFEKFGARPFGLIVKYIVGKKGLEEVRVNGVWTDNRRLLYKPRVVEEDDMEELISVLNKKGAGFVRSGSMARLMLTKRAS